jgi:hypothetical protein
MPAYSFSRLNLYDRCPWAYKTVYLDKIPRAASEALQIGSEVHDLVALYLNALLARQNQTDWNFAQGLAARVLHPDALAIWTNWYQGYILPDAIEQPQVEAKLAFNQAWQPVEWFAPAARFRLVVDFTFKQQDLAVVVDWKTNRVLPDDVAADLQLRIYGWGVRQVFYPRAQEILLRLHFLRYGADREVLLGARDLDTVPQELDGIIDMVEADDKFAPTPGSFCGHCGITAHCPVIARALTPVEILAPATKIQAEKAAALLLAIRAMDDELTVRLKQWVKDYGPIQVGDLLYGPTPVTTYNLDTEAVVQSLLEAGLERAAVWPLLSLTKTSLERGLKKLRRKELLPDLLALGSSNTIEKIGFTKL